MLTHLHIENFTLVDQIDIECTQGLTCITGETGAGKSITLDALAHILGAKTDTDKIRNGCERADIQATFDISSNPSAQSFLAALDISFDNECILRRTMAQNGRSRAYINGITVTLQNLKQFAENLLDIHSQHAQQSLLSTKTHGVLLDNFASAQNLTAKLQKAFGWWQECKNTLDAALANKESSHAHYQLLSYQANELNALNLEQNELNELEKKQKTLACHVETQQNCEKVSYLCDNEENGISAQLNQALHFLQALPFKSHPISETTQLLEQALLQVNEAKIELDRQLNSSDNTEQDLPQIESRLSAIYDVARKHKVKPEALYDYAMTLNTELEALSPSDEQIENLTEQVKLAHSGYTSLANKLSEKRRIAAKKLSSAVNKKLQLLAMEHTAFDIILEPCTTPARTGNETAMFLIATQPNMPAKPLNKIASGGELSRISLAIQVVTALTTKTPTLIFDEVDVGIGGTTGDIVGELLRELGQSTQIFCVTHLAQVASKAHNHLLVDKHINKHSVTTSIHYIEDDHAVTELARMMGGDAQSELSLAHAKQMLNG